MPRIDNDIKLDFKDVLVRPKRSTLKSRSEVNLMRSYTFRNSKQTYNGIPVMAANMNTVGTFEMAKTLASHGCFTTIHKHYSTAAWKEFGENNSEILKNVAVSAGTSETDFAKMSAILEAVPAIRYICIDVANGYSKVFVQHVKDVRARFPTHVLLAGNVVTGEMVEELLLAGADVIKVGIGPGKTLLSFYFIQAGNVVTGEMVEKLLLAGADVIKVGIGPGSVCTTRKKAGVGYPQLSAVIECADAAHGLGGHIISDGGCTCPGDVVKAFGAGADFVMLGGVFAGHDQSGGETIERNGKKLKLFYGMSSATAMDKHAGGVAEYRASEGKTVEVSYRGDVNVTIKDILGGLRSACTYVGAAKLKELSRRTTFIRVTQQTNDIFGTSTK